MTNAYDSVIAGAGPAGLSAAIILGRCRRRVLVCDTGLPRNRASRGVHGLLGHEGTPPRDLLAKGRKELEKYPAVVLRAVEIISITPEPDGFSVVCADGLAVKTRKVLLATGIEDHVPKLEGIETFYGRSVHHCPYCDGFEHRDEPIAVYGRGDKGAGLALMMKQWSPDIVLCADGDLEMAPSLAGRLEQHGIEAYSDRIARLEGTRDGTLQRIVFRNGKALARSAMFFATDCGQRSMLWKALGCVRDAKGGIVTDPLTEETSVPGVYVAGDASRDVLLVAVAAAEGAKAGVAINRALLSRDGLA